MEQPNSLKQLEGTQDSENDCFCPYCERTIEMSNNDVHFSVNKHVKSDMHLEALKLYRQNDISPGVKIDQNEESSQKKYFLNGIEDEDLIKLFMQLQLKHNYQYIVKYIIRINNVVRCTLCNHDVSSTTSDLTELTSRVHSHMVGLHLQNILKEVKSLPECNEMREFLEINNCRLKCKLCADEIRTEDVKHTMSNIHKHFENRNHINLSVTNTSVKAFPEMFSVNRYFMFMNIDGRYYCQLCKCLVDVNNECVLKHVESKNHLILLKDKMYCFFKNTENNNCLDKASIDVATCSKGKIKGSSELENTPKSIVNNDYEQLQNQFQNYLPAIVEKNQYFIVKFGKYYKCSVCDELLVYSLDFTRIKIIFKAHFKSLSHKNAVRLYLDLPPIEFNENLNTFDDKLQRGNDTSKLGKKQLSRELQHTDWLLDHSVVVKNPNVSKKDEIRAKVPTKVPKTINNDFEELKNKIEESLPSAIERNKEYVLKVGKHYKCSLCNFLTPNASDISRIVFVLKIHFRSLAHKNTLKKQLGLPLIEINKKSGEINKKRRKAK